jgi:hypothetical protein
LADVLAFLQVNLLGITIHMGGRSHQNVFLAILPTAALENAAMDSDNALEISAPSKFYQPFVAAGSA